MSDDTQDPQTEPGNSDVTPPLIASRTYVEIHEPLTLPGHCGQRLADDDLSHVVSTPPNSGIDNVDWQRSVGICQLLQRNQAIIWRIEELLGLHAIGDNRDRIGAIAKSLSCRKQFIENAEQLIRMGS